MEIKSCIEKYNVTVLNGKDYRAVAITAVKKCCLDIGLSEGQAQRQITNIQKDLVFCKGVANLLKKNPEAVQKPLTYQLEAAEVLHKVFYQADEQDYIE